MSDEIYLSKKIQKFGNQLIDADIHNHELEEQIQQLQAKVKSMEKTIVSARRLIDEECFIQNGSSLDLDALKGALDKLDAFLRDK